MTGKRNALEVLVFGRSGFVGSLVFTDTKVTIGRSRDAMVHLDDPQVSLQHATLTLDGGLFRIKDHGSRTGTRINGAPILPRQPIEPTDEIAIGPFRLRVTTCEPEPDEAPEAPTGDDELMRLASMVSELSHPTVDPFYPAARSPNGKKGGRGESAKAPPPREPTPPPSAAPRGRGPSPSPRVEALDADLLGETGETTVALPGSEVGRGRKGEPIRTPPTAVLHRPVAKEAVAPPAKSQRPAFDAYGPPSGKSPSQRPPPVESYPPPPSKSQRPPPVDSFGGFSPTVSERPATREGAHHLDTAPEVVPMAFGFTFPDAEPGLHDEDDDEEDDTNFVPPFDLIEALSAEAVDEHAARSLCLEVVHARGDRVLSMSHPMVAGPLRVAGSNVTFASVEKDGTVSLNSQDCPGISLNQGGRTLSAGEVASKTRGTRLPFSAGMQASIDLGDEDRVLLHWVKKAPEVPVPPLQLRPSSGGMTSGGASFALHIATALFIGFVVIGEGSQVDADVNAGRFATVSMKEIELQPPPPPPPPQDVPTADVAPTMDIPNQRDPLTRTKTKVPVVKGAHASDSAPASNNQPTASTQKILSALGGASNAASAISVTNLDALPSGVGGDFKVSGALGKAPGDTLRVAAAGGGGKDVDTKTTSELGGNNLGRVQGQTGGGVVRARVTASPQAVRGEGHLDRGEIQKVVNAHLFQIQGCYERQLAKDPSLGGKIAFEWDVGLTGGVSNVRVGRSSVHSVEVTSCIQSAIQGWHFPAPQGGTVTVTYPFAFSALGG